MEALEDRSLLSLSLTGSPETEGAAAMASSLDWGGVVLSGSDRGLYKIDPKSGSAGLQPKLLGYTPVLMNDLAFSRANVLYGVSAPAGSPSTSWLYRIDVSNYALEHPYSIVTSTALFPILTPTGGTVSLNSLEFDVDTLYGVGRDFSSATGDHAIFQIDVTTGTATRELWLTVNTGELAGKYHAAGDIDFRAPFGDGYITTIEQKTHSTFGQVGVLLVWHRDVVPTYLEARPVQAPILTLQGATYGRFGTSNVLIAYPQQNWPGTQVKKVRNLALNTQPWQWQEYGNMTLNTEVLGAAMLQVNNPPTVADDQSGRDDDTYTVNKNQVLVVAAPGVLSNDFDLEGDTITVKSNTLPANGTLKNNKVNPDGSFEYTPRANFFGTDTFTYIATDGFSDSVSARVTITVLGTSPPVARDDVDTYAVARATVGQPTELVVGAGQGVLINDTSFRLGNPFTAVLQTTTASGSLTLNPNGSFTYRPNAGFVGLDTFTYRAFDGVELSDRTATVAIRVFDPLGPIGFAQRAGQNPTPGELWYQFQTVRAGMVTVEALTGSAAMSLFRIVNGRFEKVADSSNLGIRQRINWQAGGPGEVYYVRLTGTDANTTLRAANLVNKVGETLHVYGTAGADQFELDSATAGIVINGVAYGPADYGVPAVTAVNFYGDAASNDTASITGSAADEKFLALAAFGMSVFTRTGLTAILNNVQTTTATGGGGNDMADMRGTAGDDWFVGTPTQATLRSPGSTYVAQANLFNTVFADGKGGTDTAEFYDAPEADSFTFVGNPNLSRISGSIAGTPYHTRIDYFRRIYAVASPGGTDRAFLSDSRGDDVLRRGAFANGTNWVQLADLTQSFFYRVIGFGEVQATSTAGNDRAKVAPVPVWLTLTGPWFVH